MVRPYGSGTPKDGGCLRDVNRLAVCRCGIPGTSWWQSVKARRGRRPLACLLLAAALVGCSSQRADGPSQSRDGGDSGQELYPFVSDGCSLSPDVNFRCCCVTHDLAYWKGGSRLERYRADEDLRRCIAGYGHEFLSYLYFYGVRIGGVPWLPTPWRWGFGRPFPAGYDEGDAME